MRNFYYTIRHSALLNEDFQTLVYTHTVKERVNSEVPFFFQQSPVIYSTDRNLDMFNSKYQY